MKTILILSDLQSPYHDVGATNAIKKFIKAYQPDVVATCGDEIDFPQISRWEEGGEGEWQRDLGRHRDITVKLLEDLTQKAEDIFLKIQLEKIYNKNKKSFDKMWQEVL